VAELKEELQNRGLAFNNKAKKAELAALLTAAVEEQVRQAHSCGPITRHT
jgi:hypothetical protein